MADEQDHDDLIDVIEDGEAEEQTSSVWRVLIVDDDEQVHQSTIFALSDKMLFERRFVFVRAYSAKEAREVLRRDTDFSVILLDVVMEAEDAGLQLVKFIREDMGLRAVRIVLRTGQPGYAPELAVIQNYDINDYRTKSELTHVRLMTTMASALRSYMQIQTIEHSRQGLRKIIDASADLFRCHVLAPFAEGVLSQIFSLLSLEPEGVVLARQAHSDDNLVGIVVGSDHDAEPVVMAAVGRFSSLAGMPLPQIPDPSVTDMLQTCLAERRNIFEPHRAVLYIRSPSGDDLAIFLAIDQPLTDLARQLLEVFSVNIAVGYDNASLFETVETLAFFDPLTHLPNRTSFQHAVARRLAQASDPALGVPAVFLIHLDGFQDVNDGLGYEVGDKLLQDIARRLAALFVSNGTLARLSGGVFALLSNVREGDDDKIVETVQFCFSQPLAAEGSLVAVTPSIGYCIADAETRDAARLVRKASMALKKAKRNSRGHAIRFTSAMEAELNRRLTVIGHLRDALHAGQFCLFYQPQIRLPGPKETRNGAFQMVGVEALLRWKRPDGTIITPDVFIQAAEDSGRIVEIGEWVLRHACDQTNTWKNSAQLPTRMSVNVSIRQMKEPGFLNMVESVLKSTAVDPAEMVLEVTESLLMEEDTLFETLRGLRGMGVKISMDDFGTGYSSLSRLHLLPLDHLKIDRSFVQGMDSQPECRSIISMIIRMGQELGLTVIAEGVETEAQQDSLIELGCQEAQGYLYARPLPSAQLETFYRSRL